METTTVKKYLNGNLIEETTTTKGDIYCNFCHKHVEKVEKMIAGPGVAICSACVDLSVKVLSEVKGKTNE